ncbi:MAG: X-Pro dipeptidyl-peptidase, partial [Acidobacteria bacterium]|nr:X-Pro dipeptidyl-peptidase [Acidobacteriota bacterium]
MVSTSGTDADWIVKLIDVYPEDFSYPARAGILTDASPASRSRMGGYQQLVRGEPMRGKFRASYERPRPFEPGTVTTVEWTMPDVLHTFRKGHRVMVQVQSTWFPLVNLNPQTFVNINTAKATAFRRATQRVYRTAGQESRITVNVLRQE